MLNCSEKKIPKNCDKYYPFVTEGLYGCQIKRKKEVLKSFSLFCHGSRSAPNWGHSFFYSTAEYFRRTGWSRSSLRNCCLAKEQLSSVLSPSQFRILFTILKALSDSTLDAWTLSTAFNSFFRRSVKSPVSVLLVIFLILRSTFK